MLLDPKTIAVISFALCGFANFGSIAVVVGAFSAVVPERASEIAQLGFRALLAATLSNLMSATIAGLFIGLGGFEELGQLQANPSPIAPHPNPLP